MVRVWYKLDGNFAAIIANMKKYLYKLYKHSDRYVAYILSCGVSLCGLRLVKSITGLH